VKEMNDREEMKGRGDRQERQDRRYMNAASLATMRERTYKVLKGFKKVLQGVIKVLQRCYKGVTVVLC
jgi:hypothetical protein